MCAFIIAFYEILFLPLFITGRIVFIAVVDVGAVIVVVVVVVVVVINSISLIIVTFNTIGVILVLDVFVVFVVFVIIFAIIFVYTIKHLFVKEDRTSRFFSPEPGLHVGRRDVVFRGPRSLVRG